MNAYLAFFDESAILPDTHAAVAQLDRALPCEGRGRTFESSQSHHGKIPDTRRGFLYTEKTRNLAFHQIACFEFVPSSDTIRDMNKKTLVLAFVSFAGGALFMYAIKTFF